MPIYNKVGRNEFPSAKPDRVGKFDVAYCYMDERMHSLMVVIPAEEDTPERVTAALQEKIEAEKKAGPASVTIE